MPAGHLILGLAACAVWALAVSRIGQLRPRLRPRAQVAAVVLGVAILGWVTWKCGPLLGLPAFLLGLALLSRPVGRGDGGRRPVPASEGE